MSILPNETKAVTFLSAMMLAGIALLAIPWFLTPPAYLDLMLRDAAFDTDLSRQQVTITDDTTGRTLLLPIRKIGNYFVARVGRINSGTGAYTARVTGYKPRVARVNAAALQAVRVPVELAPTFGRLEIATVDATRADDPVPAMVKDSARTLTKEPQRTIVLDLPPGKHRFTAEAEGFCAASREFDVREGQVTKAALPLSPDLKDDEIARFVLHWRNEPSDLDTHLWRLDGTSFPSPTKVYFENKAGVMPGGVTFARLDVDKIYPGAYETLTVRDTAAGDFSYFIHVFQGHGTIADAAASIQVYTSGCRARTITPPPDCAFRIWDVATLRHGAGGMELIDVQRCKPEGTIRIRKR